MERSKLTGLAAFCLLALICPAAISTQERGTVELTRAAIETRRQQIITQIMSLDQQQSEAFLPVYREYRQEMERVNEHLVKLLACFDQRPRNISELRAREMVNEYLKYEEARLEAQKKYMSKLGQVLPPKKIAWFYQLENKLDAIVNFELAGSVEIID